MKRLFLAALCATALSSQDREVSIYLTSNLAGRFPLDADIADNHLMRVAAFLSSERARDPNSLYFDLGNAFYPGRLSRFSLGSLTADYLQMLRLDAGLVAARDLGIGAYNLSYISRARGIRLLSANIMRDGAAFFDTVAQIDRGGLKTGVIGITSAKSLLSLAEAQYLGLKLLSPEPRLVEKLTQAADDADLRIALTGLPLQDAATLLGRNSALDLIVSGGDADGSFGSETLRRAELIDGRPIITMPRHASLIKIRLKKAGKRWAIIEQREIDLESEVKSVILPPTFARRMALWQKWYAIDEDKDLAAGRLEPFFLKSPFAAAAVRNYFGCDVAFLESDDIDEVNFGEIKKLRDIRFVVQDDYDVFTTKIKGVTLRQFYQRNPGLIFSGIKDNLITGYPIRDTVNYRVCATERGQEIMAAQIAERPPAESQWLGISGAVTEAVKEKQNDPNAVADRKFHLLTLFNLSNTYETGKIHNNSLIGTPPGQPQDSYFKWGLENDVNFLFYNRRNLISFNPYIFYVRQNEQIVRNLLRLDLTYTYNTEWYIRPYQKSRLDTVVVPVNGLSPSFLRETIGAEFTWKFITGRLGAGLEKEIQDPARNPNWGLESNLAVLWEFFPGIKYKLGFDAFSSRTYEQLWRHRVEVGNSLIFTLVDPLTYTIGHRWYYFYLESARDSYNASILLMSIDLRTNWKWP